MNHFLTFYSSSQVFQLEDGHSKSTSLPLASLNKAVQFFLLFLEQSWYLWTQRKLSYQLNFIVLYQQVLFILSFT